MATIGTHSSDANGRATHVVDGKGMPNLTSVEAVRAMLDSLSAQVAIVDTEGEIVAVNESWKRFADDNGLNDSGFCVGANYLKVCDSAGGASCGDALVTGTGMRRVLQGREPLFIHQYGCHSPSEQRWYQMRVTPFESSAGLGGAVVVHEEITQAVDDEHDRRERLATIAHAQRLEVTQQMSAALAHEINQPLAAISAYISGSINLLKSAGQGSDEILGALEKAGKESERASQVVSALRRFVRKGALETEPIDAREVVTQTLPLLEHLMKHNRHDVVLDLPEHPIQADLHLVQMQQVIMNLVRNALEAMNELKDAGVVTVSMTGGDGEIQIVVTDRGHGFRNGVPGDLFEPFVTRTADGVGLGLAISRSIIEAHGGRIWAENATDSAGAVIGARIGMNLPTKQFASSN